MRAPRGTSVVIRHTYNLVDLPIVVAGKTGTAEFGTPDHRGDLPFHSWFAVFVPKDPCKKASDPNGWKAVQKTDSELAVLVFAYNSGTLGNAATEIAKYYFQLHFDIKKDYRNAVPPGARQLLRGAHERSSTSAPAPRARATGRPRA